MIKFKQPNFLYGSFFSSLKNCVLKKKNKFLCYGSGLNRLLCEYLQKQGFFLTVFYFSSRKKSQSFIYCTLSSACTLKSLKSYFNPSRKLTIKLKKSTRVISLDRKNQLLSTSHGILHMSSAIERRQGGIILFEYN